MLPICCFAVIVITVVASTIDGSLQSKPRGSLNYYCRPKVCECRSVCQMVPNGDKITGEIKTAVKAINRNMAAQVELLGKKCGEPSPPKRKGRDCAELFAKGITKSGVYRISPFTSGIRARKSVLVYCDMKTDGGGWTVFQRRRDGSVDFYRGWEAYRSGFGSTKGEYWLGNDVIHVLTSNRDTTLRVELEDWSGKTAYAKYGLFSVGSAPNKYRLHVARYSGTAGDGLTHINGQPFSTKDKDNDASGGHCADRYKGAWWFKACFASASHLNGIYQYNNKKQKDWAGLHWVPWQQQTSQMRTEMKIRPNNFGW